MNSLFDLLSGYSVPEPKKHKTERGELLSFFASEMNRSVKFMGIRLAHYSLDELYALKSAFMDRVTRNSHVSAEKYFWYITKVVGDGQP